MDDDRRLYWEVADTCTRCEQAFPLDAVRYMVPENIVYQSCHDGAFVIHQRAVVAVCVGCLRPRESGPWRDFTCAGCRAPLRKHGYSFERDRGGIIACCPRCRLRAQRARKRAARPLMPCVVCEKNFRPTRADARYCSDACRQKGYRWRESRTSCPLPVRTRPEDNPDGQPPS